MTRTTLEQVAEALGQVRTELTRSPSMEEEFAVLVKKIDEALAALRLPAQEEPK